MGPVTIDDVGTVVDTEMGHLAQRTAVLAEEGLLSLWQMALVASFGSAMERDDDDVATVDEIIDNAAYGLQVGMAQRVAVMSESTDANLLALALDDGTLGAACDAREEDALALQLVLR